MAILLPDIIQKVVLNSRQTQTGLLVVERGFRKMGNEAAQQSAKAATAMEALQARLDEVGDEAARATRKVEELTREIAKLRAMSAAGGGGRRGGGGDVIGELAKSAGFFAAAIKVLAIPTIIWGIGQLIPMINSLAAGLLGLSGALGPVMGGFAAIPGLIAPVAQGFGSVALAVSGVSEAFKLFSKQQEVAKDTSWADAQVQAAGEVAVANAQLGEASAAVANAQTWEQYNAAVAAQAAASANVTRAKNAEAAATRRANQANREYEEAMAKLDPSVRRFVEKVEEIRPQFEALRRQAQRGLFPGVVDAMERLRVLFGPIGSIVQMTTQVFGDFARQLADVVTSPAWTQDLALFGVENVSLLDRAGDFLLDILDALRNLGVAAMPLVNYFARLGEEAGEWLQVWAESGRETGRFETFFARTANVLDQLGRLARNFSSGLLEVFRIGGRLGQDMLDSWEVAGERFRDWTQSAEGQRRINAYFDQMRPILYEIGNLFADIFRAFNRITTENGAQTAALIRQLREQFLPALVRVFSALSTSFGPAVIDAVTSFVDLIGGLMERTSALTALMEVLSGIFKALAAVMRMPVIGDLVFGVLALVGAFRALKFVSIITGFKGLGAAAVLFAKGLWGTKVAAEAGSKGMLKYANTVGEKVRAAFASAAGAVRNFITTHGAMAALRVAAYAGAAIAIWSAYSNTVDESRKKAEALRDELMKDVDLNNYDEVTRATNNLVAEHNRAVDEWNAKGFDNPLRRLGQGFWEMLPGTKNTMHDLAEASGVLGKQIADNVTRGDHMVTVYQAIARRMGITTNEAKSLAQELGIDLNPAIDALESGAAGAANEVDNVARKTEAAADRARNFTPAGEALADAFDRIAAEGANATDRLLAFDDILSGLSNPLREAEMAQQRWDEITGKTTKTVDGATQSVDNYGRSVEDLSAEWAEKQKEATADIAEAQANLDRATAAIGEARTWEEYQSALDAHRKAQEDVTRAKAEAARIEREASRAQTRTVRSTTGVSRATGSLVDRAWELYDVTQDQLKAEYNRTGSLDAVNAKFGEMRPQLERTLRQMGANEEQVRHYMAELEKIPKAIETAIFLTAATPEQARLVLQKSRDNIQAILAAHPELQPRVELKMEWAGMEEMPPPPPFKVPVAPAPMVTSGPVQIIGGIPYLTFEQKQAGDIGRAPMVTNRPILWGEGRGPEAYIPYEARYRNRAVGLLSQVAHDFGLAVIPKAHRGRSFAAGAVVPHMAMAAVDSQIRRLQAGAIVRPGSGASGIRNEHHYGGIYVETVDRASGERLGRDIAWTLIGSRGSPVQKVIQ